MAVGDLGAIEADVDFDFGVATLLASGCDDAASAVSGQAGIRAAAVTTGLTDFKGHFSELFRANAAVAAGDAVELSSRLGEVATGVRRLAEEARKEQQRRETARAWKKEHDDRNVAEKVWDWGTGGDDPPVGPPAAEPTIAVSPAVNRSRQTPAAGGGGGAGGSTSSARPSSLRTFATTSSGANAELATRPATLKGRFNDFVGACHWGSLDASGVFVGFDRWLAANDEDVRWATAVANAFKAAGGEGAVSTLSNSAVKAALKAAHVTVSRKDLVIDPPQAFGNPPTTGYADDPVNTATGNFVENETDLVFPGAAAGLVWARSYSSANPESGGFGPGWSSLAEAGLSFDAAEGSARLSLADGREVVFSRLGEGWDRAVGENLWLAQVPDSTDIRASGNEGSWWRFTAAGVLTAYGTGPVEARAFVEVGRDDAGRVVRLTQARGQWISLDWSGDRVVAVSSADGRTVGYGYDERGRLVSATGPAGTRTYRWNDQGLVAAVVDADGVVEVENSYDAQGRVTGQRSPFGRTTRYAYLPGRVTVVSDEGGTRSNTWISDERGRLVGVVDADEHRQSTSCDRWGNPVLSTERDGATTVHEYDDRGRRIRTVTPSGADLTFGYDDLDRVTTVVTEQGAVTEYGYHDEHRNPATIVDPEGGVTRLSWAQGLLVETLDPTEVSLRFGYDAHGDLVTVTNADGATAGLERDALGRVTAAVTPSGHRTTYAYDPATGLLESRRNPDGGTWRYEYTAAGRMAATVDPLGARTSVEHGPHGEESAAVDPIGRSVTRRLDDLGNLASVELPDGSTWRFVHDALSRLTAAVDPCGGVWAQEYDEAGHPVAGVDPSGVRVGVDLDQGQAQVTVGDGTGSSVSGFDPLGRLTTSTLPDGSAAVYTYDRCGRPVEALDADGGLTLIRRDAAGRPVEVTTPTGATTRYGYDRCGRLVSVTDPLGAVTAIGYDIDSRPVTQTLPTGEVARSAYDACGRIVEHHAPGVGTNRWGYDLAGRVVEWQDPRSGRRRFRYDAAGQLVAAVDGNGGTTTYGYDANGRTVEIVNPVGGFTRREFDGMDRCVAETDPLGRTTRAGYDGAGRLAWQESPDGRRTTWTYDAAGRPASMAVDGRTVTALTRDLRRRTVRVTDHTDADRVVEHELEWNRGGQLVRRARDGRAVTWSYDANGRRTTMTTPDGATTAYGWDAAGRLASVDHSVLGRAAFDRDAAGRVVSALAGGLVQSWQHADGFLVAHTVTDGQTSTRTTLDRDPDGRITRLVEGSSTTDYAYDGACQLVGARTRATSGASTTTTTTRWRYDAAGRLVAESVDDATVQHVYDVAGQLLSSVDAEGRRVSHHYDDAGRRTQTRDDRGSRDFVWNPSGYLAGVVHHRADRVRRTTIRTDALGELAEVDGTEFFFDTAGFAGAPVLAGDTPILSAGPVTGVGTGWTSPGWRTERSSAADPWGSDPAATVGGSGAVTIGASGGVSIDGLEWLGARAYDPQSRGFLSVDPLDPVTASGWAGNPYAYAGNDPLHALDPTGLSPVTDAELQAYRDNNGIAGTYHAVSGALNTALDATGHWLKNNWEYVAGGAMVVAGGALMITGVGGPAGAMLISAGADTIIQKATTGEVNWGEVGVSFAAGAIGGGFAAAKLGATGVRAAVVSGAVSGAVGGAGMSGYQYATGPGPHTAGGFLGATARGAGTGAAFGGVGGAAGHGLQTAGGKLLSHAEPAVTACFVADTQVLLADGTTKPIEDVDADDEVRAYNPETGLTEARRVVRSYVHEDVPTYDVVLDDGDLVTTTSEHPFMVDGRGWTAVQDLEKGDRLVRPDGGTIPVLSVNATGDTATVHNFEVEGLHNYYVRAGEHWLLVHNTCGTEGLPNPIPRDALYHYTDAAGSAGIAEHGVIRAGMKNRVHLTPDQVSPEDAANTLFAGGHGDYAGRGSHVAVVRVPDGVELTPGSQPNELYTQGSVRPEILYNGKNPF